MLHRESVGPNIKRAASVAVLLLPFTGYRSDSAMGQAKGPAQVFRPALEEIQSQMRIPILLPSTLPAVIPERVIKLASGEVRDDGYFVSLYYSEEGSNATFAAGFGGSTHTGSLQGRQNIHRVALSGGRIGMFRPVSCGGSCVPANLWWEQNGVVYQIQIKLRSGSTEKSQEKILVQTANSMVTARPE